MKTIAKRAMERAISKIHVWPFRLLIRPEMIVLCYHVVSERSLTHVKNLYPYKTPQMFEQDLIYLKRYFNVISYEEAVECASGNGRRKAYNVLLTFDDGYAECFSVVRPLLLKHKFPCIFFIATDFIDNKCMFYRNLVSLCIERLSALGNDEMDKCLKRIDGKVGGDLGDLGSFTRWIKSLEFPDSERIGDVCGMLGIDVEGYLAAESPYLSSEQVRQLASDGFIIGGHTKSHARLGLLTDKEIECEVVDSCKVIRALTGQERVPFAFPFSGEGVNRSVLEELIKKHPFVGLLFETKGLKRDKPFIVNRIWADPPPRGDVSRSNLSDIVYAAYCEYRNA